MAKSAGFCFGVNRAVQMVSNLLDQGKRVATLGPIIHNPQIINSFSSRGVRIVDRPEEVLPKEVLVIRSHGVPQKTMDLLWKMKIDYEDATCPDLVEKIHQIVLQASKDGRFVFIIGDYSHPEVQGIFGYCSDRFHVFATAEEIEAFSKMHQIPEDIPITWSPRQPIIQKNGKLFGKNKKGIYKCRGF